MIPDLIIICIGFILAFVMPVLMFSQPLSRALALCYVMVLIFSAEVLIYFALTSQP